MSMEPSPIDQRAMPGLEDLSIHSIDLHYHAGQERQPGKTLADYLAHAVMTGRVILGVTDHLERYIANPLTPTEHPLYEQSVAGFMQYRADVDALRDAFPTLKLFFGPEIHSHNRIDIQHIPAGIVEVSDFFLCAIPGVERSLAENTEAMLRRIPEIRDLAERVGRPTFVCHPFRPSVDYRLVRHDIESWITALRPRPRGDFTDDELNTFFRFDVRAVARACREHTLPVEINGGTVARIRALNLPTPLQMLWAAYRLFRDEGVGFVPGSDQHAFMQGTTRREGRYVPYDAFEMLGLGAGDILFVKQLLEGVKEEVRQHVID